MALSGITVPTAIPERSDASPGLWNSRYNEAFYNIQSLYSNVSTYLNLPVSTNTLRPESGSTIRVLNGSDLILRSIDSGGAFWNVLSFGSDVSAINNAISAAAAVGGGRVYVPRGVYSGTTDVVIRANDIELFGDGWESVISIATLSTGRGVVASFGTDASNRVKRVMIRDLKIQSNSTGSLDGFLSNNKGVYLQYAEDIKVQNVWVEKVCGEAIYSQTDGERIDYINCLVTDSAFNAYCHNGGISRAAITNCRAARVGNLGYEGAASEIVVTGNNFIGCRSHGIAYGQLGAAGSVSKAIFSGNIIAGCGTGASQYGILVQNGGQDVVISGNVVRQNAGGGIYFNHPGSVSGATSDRAVISGNIVSDNSGTYQMLLSGARCAVKDNVVVRTAAGGNYGIYCDDSSAGTSMVVEGNIVLNHSTADIFRSKSTSATFGRNRVTSGDIFGDRTERVTLTFTKADFSADGQATIAYRMPYDYDVVAIGSFHESVTTGTFEAAPFKNGGGNLTIRVSTNTSSTSSAGGYHAGLWSGHTAGTRLSAGIVNATGVAPTGQTISFIVAADLKITEANSLS
jgi:hypothetical protein